MCPFYTISKLRVGVDIDEESQKNILRFKELWFESIADVVRNERKYFAIVNPVNLPDNLLVVSNPLRSLYREVINHAKQSLKDRLFYFSPSIELDSLQIEKLSETLHSARKNYAQIIYEPQSLKIYAYGEHVDIEGRCGCVISEARSLAKTLKISSSNVIIDYEKSLPAQPVIGHRNQLISFSVPEFSYINATQFKKLFEEHLNS